MSGESTGRLPALLAEYAEVEAALADPAVHTEQGRARQLGRRFAELAPIHATASDLEAARADREAALELADEDDSFAAEAVSLGARIDELEARMRELLVPKDPNDLKDVILEVKAGEGGDESALFAADLLRMYLRYAERQGWVTETLDEEPTDLGGVKSATIAVRARRNDDAVWAHLKYEGGVHRVQRVPATESQGRIHTSAAGVLALPEAEDVEVEIDPNDLRIDVYRSSGPGGQSVNTTDSAVRITHVPTGTVVSMQNEKSQLQNREAGMRVLRARLLAAAQEQADAAASDARRSQVRTVDRSERVRTYNFPENRISDHRVGFKAYNLDQVLDGALEDVIAALTRADMEALLAGSAPTPGSPLPDGRCGAWIAATRAWPDGGEYAVTGADDADVRRVLADATAELVAAGIASPRVDAELLLAARLGRPRTALLTRAAVPAHALDGYADDVRRRATREPLQHITGTAPFRHVELAVGPGVFVPVPRPNCWSTPCSPTCGERLIRSSSTCAPGPGRWPWRWPARCRTPGCSRSNSRRMRWAG